MKLKPELVLSSCLSALRCRSEQEQEKEKKKKKKRVPESDRFNRLDLVSFLRR